MATGSTLSSRGTAWTLLLLLAVTLAGCLDKPEVAVARKFMQALIQRDVPAAHEVVVPEGRDQVMAAAVLDFGLGVALQEFTASRGKIAYQKLKLRPLHVNADSALVEVQGNVNFKLEQQQLSLPFHFNLRMEKRDKHWLVAGVLPAG
jgi:hypothetical protein